MGNLLKTIQDALDVVAELAAMWLDGTDYDDLQDDVCEHIPEVVYTSDLLEYIEEDTYLLFAPVQEDAGNKVFDVIAAAIYEKIEARVYEEMRWMEDAQPMLTEMLDEGWKFEYISGSEGEQAAVEYSTPEGNKDRYVFDEFSIRSIYDNEYTEWLEAQNDESDESGDE